ncbi:hypothetical protein AB0395_14320 [Streptosporangium sp. NPDC051023]|uniref:hypothetical protein n=1 Tax=Streptosporangium sp. NPDC051023 TaxID=3155410 RepID=UPI00344F73E4
MSAISRDRTRQFLNANLLPFFLVFSRSAARTALPSCASVSPKTWAATSPDSRSLGIDAVLTGLRYLSSVCLIGGDPVMHLIFT